MQEVVGPWYNILQTKRSETDRKFEKESARFENTMITDKLRPKVVFHS
jgi:hypothetical protein